MILPASALAGCTGGADPFVPAKDKLGVAQEAASAWSTNATLVQVQGIDPAVSPPQSGGEDATPLAWRLDPDLGDGRSQAWGYLFTAPDRETSYHVVVAGNGTVRHAAEQQANETGAFTLEPNVAPVEGWEVDSDEAARVVADANGTWNVLGEDPATLVTFSMLWGRGDEDPFWVFGAETAQNGSADGAGGAFEHTFFVNATTGDYLGTSPPGNTSLYELRPRDGPPAEGGRFNGTVSAVEPETTHTFDIERAGHPWLTVGIEVGASSGAELELVARDPGGEERENVTLDLSAGGSGGAGVRVEAPQTGTWSATVTLEEGQAARYRLDWCAADDPPSGAGGGGPTASGPPCGEDPDR